METLIHAVRRYSQEKGIELGIEKCTMVLTKRDKRHMRREWNCQIETRLERLEKRKRTNTWAFWKLTPSYKWRWEKNIKEYLRRIRKLLETKLWSRNLIKGMNSWAVLLIRYSGPFLKWTREELKQMDQRTRKLMPMKKVLRPRDDVYRLYVSRKEGRRGLECIKDCVEASIQRLADYIEKQEELITTSRNDTSNTDQ